MGGVDLPAVLGAAGEQPDGAGEPTDEGGMLAVLALVLLGLAHRVSPLHGALCLQARGGAEARRLDRGTPGLRERRRVVRVDRALGAPPGGSGKGGASHG